MAAVSTVSGKLSLTPRAPSNRNHNLNCSSWHICSDLHPCKASYLNSVLLMPAGSLAFQRLPACLHKLGLRAPPLDGEEVASGVMLRQVLYLV